MPVNGLFFCRCIDYVPSHMNDYTPRTHVMLCMASTNACTFSSSITCAMYNVGSRSSCRVDLATSLILYFSAAVYDASVSPDLPLFHCYSPAGFVHLASTSLICFCHFDSRHCYYYYVGFSRHKWCITCAHVCWCVFALLLPSSTL